MAEGSEVKSAGMKGILLWEPCSKLPWHSSLPAKTTAPMRAICCEVERVSGTFAYCQISETILMDDALLKSVVHPTLYTRQSQFYKAVKTDPLRSLMTLTVYIY